MNFSSFCQMYFSKEVKPTSISQYHNLEFLGAGSSCIAYAIDHTRIVKQYMNPNETEYHAFLRIGSHPHIVKFLGRLDDGCILLELGKLLRKALRERHYEPSLQTKMQWLREAASAIQYIHRKGIVHADIGCHNMILVDGQVKLIDFEGCSIDGSEAGSCYEWFSYRVGSDVCEQSDIFAYGCMVYEIITGNHPYHELHDDEFRESKVQRYFQNNQFPDVSRLAYGGLMRHCWEANLQSMSEVITELDNEAITTGTATV